MDKSFEVTGEVLPNGPMQGEARLCPMHGVRIGDPIAAGVNCNGNSPACNPDVKVRTGEIELRTCKLTKSILKQIPVVTYDTFRNETTVTVPDATGSQPKRETDRMRVVGWVHGSVLGDDYKPWLIYRDERGDYKRFAAAQATCNKFQQLYVI